MKKNYKVLFSLFLIISCCSSGWSGDDHWKIISKGELAEVLIEKVLYKQPDSKYFYVHFLIRNKTDRKIGVDVHDRQKVFYPNQWGAYEEDHRMEINERRIVPEPLSDKHTADLLHQFKEGGLTFIEPLQSLNYYCMFNAGSYTDVDKAQAQGKYFILSVDGQLFLTDGEAAETLITEFGTNSELMIAYPMIWSNIPAEALVIK